MIGASVEVHGARAQALRGIELGPGKVERGHAIGQRRRQRAELDRGRAIVGVERDRAVRVEMDLADRGRAAPVCQASSAASASRIEVAVASGSLVYVARGRPVITGRPSPSPAARSARLNGWPSASTR